MGRTYRRQDKKFKKKLKDGRRVKQNKRIDRDDEHPKGKTKDRDRESGVGSYLLTWGIDVV